MSENSIALEAIEEFAALAIRRRVRQLPPDDRDTMDALEEVLRDVIEGARPKPKRAETLGEDLSLPDEEQTAPNQGMAAKAKKQVGPGQNLKLQGLADELAATMEKRGDNKVREVTADMLPRSHYTPSAAPAYLGDYYSDDIIPVDVSTSDVPSNVVRADGEEAELKDEWAVFFGLSEPPPQQADVATDVVRRRAPKVRSGSVSRQPQPGRPSIVHFVVGGTKRGQIAPFDPESGQVVFLPRKQGEAKEVVDLEDVLAIFFGLSKSETPTEADGEPVVVTLVNDKRVAGLTSDYEEGAEFLTIVPNPRRGNIDRIWIPASAVKAIEMP